MGKQNPIEIFTPPNLLKAKVGGTVVGLDMSAVARAEKAFEKLQSEFADWIKEDVDRLCDARKAFVGAPDDTTQAALHRAAHDLRGQALTFGYPLAARIAVSLCKLLEAVEADARVPLAEAHVDAIRIIVRDKLKGDANATAERLAAELETRVSEALADKTK